MPSSLTISLKIHELVYITLASYVWDYKHKCVLAQSIYNMQAKQNQNSFEEFPSKEGENIYNMKTHST